ncbi:hypothetical protein B0T20DRAFT_166602 [Sordaria brevicollis]|uniref:Uncharacterized protein n=1 Tax=Sordaria brevicollis TaxID=83679 RepID=A0AAE0PGM9_SORBR|nr:hypothetical protein B0T20DRAFT_166602 [Sordaria brevicollis]
MPRPHSCLHLPGRKTRGQAMPGLQHEKKQLLGTDFHRTATSTCPTVYNERTANTTDASKVSKRGLTDRRVDGRNRHCTKEGQKTSKLSTVKSQRMLLATQLSSYSWPNSTCSLAPPQHQGIAQGPADGDQGHPRCRDQSLLSITTYTSKRSITTQDQLQAASQRDQLPDRSQHDRERQKDTQSSTVPIFLLVVIPFRVSLSSLATTLRPYSRESAQLRSNTFPTCVMLDALPALSLHPPVPARSQRPNQDARRQGQQPYCGKVLDSI